MFSLIHVFHIEDPAYTEVKPLITDTRINPPFSSVNIPVDELTPISNELSSINKTQKPCSKQLE